MPSCSRLHSRWALAFLTPSLHTWRVSIFLLGHLYLLPPVACCLFKSAFSQDLLVHPCSQPAAFAWQWLNSSLGTGCVWRYRHRKRVQGRKFSSWRNRVNSSVLISMSTSNIYTRRTTANAPTQHPSLQGTYTYSNLPQPHRMSATGQECRHNYPCLKVVLLPATPPVSCVRHICPSKSNRWICNC